MKYKIAFTLNGYEKPDVYVCLYDKDRSFGYFCGHTYEVNDAIAYQMLSLNSFRPFGPIQVALDAYHNMYKLVPR